MTGLFAHATRWRAERALARGRSDSALRLYRRLAGHRGAHPSDRLRCARMLEEQGDRAGSIHLLQVWVAEAPGPELRQQLAEALMRAGRHAESAEHWAALVHEGALPPETLLQLGAAIADQGAVGRAEGMFSDSFHGSDDPELRCAAWRHYAAMAEAAGRHDTALERWKLLSAFAPLEEGDWRHVGTLAARLGEAETVREAAAQLADPDDRAALRQLLADREQDWAAARRATADRLALAAPGSDDEAQLCRSLVRYAVRAGDDRSAVRAFLDFRRRDPEAVATEATVVVQAAQALRRMGRPARAEAVLRAHLAARSEGGEAADPRADLFLAELLMARGARLEAIAALDRAALGAPDAAAGAASPAPARPPLEAALEARRIRLWAHIASAEGAHREAAELFRASNGTGHATEASALREVEAWAALGETRERSLALRRGLGRFPASLGLARHAALFAEEEGDWESAAQAWGHCAERHPDETRVAHRFALALLEARRPYHFLSVVEALPDAQPVRDDPQGAQAPGGREGAEGAEGATFDARLVAAYLRLLRAQGEGHDADLAALERLARSPDERAAVARFAARAARAPVATAPSEPAAGAVMAAEADAATEVGSGAETFAVSRVPAAAEPRPTMSVGLAPERARGDPASSMHGAARAAAHAALEAGAAGQADAAQARQRPDGRGRPRVHADRGWPEARPPRAAPGVPGTAPGGA